MNAEQLSYAIANALLTKNKMIIDQLKVENEKLQKDIDNIKAKEPKPPKPRTLLEVYYIVNPVWYLSDSGEPKKLSLRQLNFVPTEADARIAGIHSMLKVLAVYLNGDWKPDWNNVEQSKYHLVYNAKTLKASAWHTSSMGLATFATRELVMEAVAIIDEHFGKDYVLNAFKNG